MVFLPCKKLRIFCPSEFLVLFLRFDYLISFLKEYQQHTYDIDPLLHIIFKRSMTIFDKKRGVSIKFLRHIRRGF